MPNVRIGEAFHKLDGTPYGTGKSLDSLNNMQDGTMNLSRRKQMN